MKTTFGPPSLVLYELDPPGSSFFGSSGPPGQTRSSRVERSSMSSPSDTQADMNHFAVLDDTANLVDSFDREDEARAALEAIAHRDPAAADGHAFLTYDDEGHVVGQAITAADLGMHA